MKSVTLLCGCRGHTLISSARLKRLSWRSLMYSDFTLLFQQAGPFSERFPVSTMVHLRSNEETLTATIEAGEEEHLCIPQKASPKPPCGNTDSQKDRLC